MHARHRLDLLLVSSALSLLAGCQRSAPGGASVSAAPADPAPSACEAFAAIGRGDLARATRITDELQRRQALALADGRAAIGAAREMRALYPGVVEFFSYYTGEAAGTVWNSTVALHGRYELTLQVPVTLDASRTHVVAQGEPGFFLAEVDRLEPYPDDPTRPAGVHYAGSVHFGATAWAGVVEAGGDLSSVLKKPVRTDAPVEGFAGEWARAHTP